MAIFRRTNQYDKTDDFEALRTRDDGRLFKPGAQYPPPSDIERLAKYHRGRKIFDGKQAEVYERATEILKEDEWYDQLRTLYISVNIIDILVTKPADLMFGEAPQYESGFPDDSPQQKAVNRIVESNELNLLGHETVIGAGYRGDAFLKTYFAKRQDMSAVPEGLEIPESRPEPIIESVNPSFVFPELARGSSKKFKAVNIAWPEWVDNGKEEIPYLNVERHVPGYILYERFKLYPSTVNNEYDAPIQTFKIGDKVPTGRENDIIQTGLAFIPIHHIPYKTTDDTWQGISGVEKLESVLAAINDRLVQIDYILWKHADPVAYGPELEGADENSVKWGGSYIPLSSTEMPTPGYMTWNAQLADAFKQLDYLLGLVYQMSETPQWLFGTTLAGDNRGGSGTSHTDGAAIKSRFMPILSKVKRIRTHVDKAFREALYTAQKLENYANEDVPDFESYEPTQIAITWKDGIPRDEKEAAEIMAIRTGNRPTIDTHSAIKYLDEVDDAKATEIQRRIKVDEEQDEMVDGSIFRLERQRSESEEEDENDQEIDGDPNEEDDE